MNNREFLQLAKVHSKQAVAGWFVSEKLDGMRAFWDGGLTRGMITSEVPWSNTIKDKNETISTGLWSRYGKVIYAPDYWLDELPPYPLDGELYIGRGTFQKLMSIVKRSVNILETEWMDVEYRVFDSPTYSQVFVPGKIKWVNIDTSCLNWIKKRFGGTLEEATSFKGTYELLLKNLDGNKVIVVHEQLQLPFATYKAQAIIDKMIVEISRNGGEGLMLRNPIMPWFPKRCDTILKIKPTLDAEGEVLGYRPGKGKYFGKLGSLIIGFGVGTTFDLSGFTDEERELDYLGQSRFFPIGSQVTFTYRELTGNGLPKEARFLRHDSSD